MHLMTYAQLVLFIVDNGLKIIIFYFPFFPQLLFLLLYSHVHLFHFLTIPCSIYLRCLHFILKLILNFYIIFPSLKLAVSPSDLWFQLFPIVPFSKSVIIYFLNIYIFSISFRSFSLLFFSHSLLLLILSSCY